MNKLNLTEDQAEELLGREISFRDQVKFEEDWLTMYRELNKGNEKCRELEREAKAANV
jgi:hypothetical protein